MCCHLSGPVPFVLGVPVAMADYGKELSAIASYFNVKCGQISFTGNEKVLWLLPVN